MTTTNPTQIPPISTTPVLEAPPAQLPALPTPEAKPVKAGPSVGDRLNAGLRGTLLPLNEFPQVFLGSFLGAGLLQIMGVHMGNVPYLNFIATLSNVASTPFAANFLATLTGAFIAYGVYGAVNAFTANPTGKKNG